MNRASDDAAMAEIWVARMDGDDWSAEDESQLQAWLAQDKRRHGALMQAEAAWLALDGLRAGPPGQVDAEPEAVVRPRPALTRRWMMAGGGSLTAAALVLGWLRLSATTSYRTQTGEMRRIPLTDGSVVAINTATRLDVTLASARRLVRIHQGEAWFQVAKDKSRPFVVEAGRARAQAVGTAFSVRKREGGADILVTEGIVDVWAEGGGSRLRLTAGQSAFIADDAGIARAPDSPSAVDRKLAWRDGEINLVGSTLDDAIAEFNRYNHRRIMLDDPMLGHEQFDGVFRTDDPQGFAIAVRDSLSVPIDVSDANVIRIGRSGP